MTDKQSNCCNADILEPDICSACKEHCSPQESELRQKYVLFWGDTVGGCRIRLREEYEFGKKLTLDQELFSWLEDQLQAQTSSYRAAIEKMRKVEPEEGVIYPFMANNKPYNQALYDILDLLTEGKV